MTFHDSLLEDFKRVDPKNQKQRLCQKTKEVEKGRVTGDCDEDADPCKWHCEWGDEVQMLFEVVGSADAGIPSSVALWGEKSVEGDRVLQVFRVAAVLQRANLLFKWVWLDKFVFPLFRVIGKKFPEIVLYKQTRKNIKKLRVNLERLENDIQTLKKQKKKEIKENAAKKIEPRPKQRKRFLNICNQKKIFWSQSTNRRVLS